MSFNITVEGGSSVRLPTAGKYCDQDIVITATGGGGSGDLPAGYTPLEYIKSSGTQHINTKFFPDSNSRVVATVKFDSVPIAHAGLFGSRTGTTEQFWCYYRYNDLTFATRYGTNADIKISATSTQKNVVEMNRNTLVVNGQTVQGSAQTFTGQYEMYLFSVNQSGATQNTSSFCLYSCQIYDNDVLVRDYLPCRNPKNEVGLYDTVTGEFYGNVGTGAFDGSAGGTVPIGTKQITENGIYDVTEYAKVDVNVPTEGGGGDTNEEWIGDGNTHIWIHLEEGRTSPSLGCIVNGTVIVDWGDGTETDVLTGSQTFYASTPTTVQHNYASAGDYIITLTADGVMRFCGNNASDSYSYILRNSFSADKTNHAYHVAVKKIEIGDESFIVSSHAFSHCYSLTRINISDSITFEKDGWFRDCYGLTNISIPDGITQIGAYAFNACYGLAKIRFNSTTPPTVSNSNVFTGIPTDCIISVPVGCLEAYTTATNYPSASTYTYIEED